MSDENPSLQDIWRLLGTMNRRFDSLERQVVSIKSDVTEEVAKLRGEMQAGFGALKASIEARDFRLDDHGRRLTELETSRT